MSEQAAAPATQATFTVSLTFGATKDNMQERLRRIMDGFVAAVPQADRLHSSVSIHDPADVVVCVQQLESGKVQAWQVDPSGPLAAAQAEVSKLQYRVHQLEAQVAGMRQGGGNE